MLNQIASGDEGDSACLERSEFFPLLDERVTDALAIETASALTPDAGRNDRLAVVSLIEQTLQSLPSAILSVDLDKRAEFQSLFQFMVGLGISDHKLSAHLDRGVPTIARYRKGLSAPESPSERRGVLVETYRLLQREVASRAVPYLAYS